VLGFTPDAEHGLGAEALTEAPACRIGRRELERLFRLHPALERHFLDFCARELAATQDHLVAIGRFTAEERVAAFLVSFAEAQERRGRRGPVFDLPATRADMGDLLGLTLETVSRTLSAFNEIGLITVDQRSIGIKDVEALRTLRRLPPSSSRAKQVAAKKSKAATQQNDQSDPDWGTQLASA